MQLLSNIDNIDYSYSTLHSVASMPDIIKAFILKFASHKTMHSQNDYCSICLPAGSNAMIRNYLEKRQTSCPHTFDLMKETLYVPDFITGPVDVKSAYAATTLAIQILTAANTIVLVHW